jgi:hypothetical protein
MKERYCLPYSRPYLQAVSWESEWNEAPCCIKECQIALLAHDGKCLTVWEPVEACNPAAPMIAWRWRRALNPSQTVRLPCHLRRHHAQL